LQKHPSPRLLTLLLLAMTVAAYWPTFSNGFLNYDDPGYVTQNSHVQRGLTAGNVAWAFHTTIMANWHPLTWFSHMADVQIFGMKAGMHHAASLFFHGCNVVLLFYLLLRGTGFLWRSFVVAALFAVSPLNVECVAWISERKSLLCTLFLLLTLAAYGWYCRKPGVPRYLLVAISFGLGLLAKPMIVTLPLALLLVDYWPLHRLPVPEPGNARTFLRRSVLLGLEKFPLLLLTAASSYLTVIAQGRGNAIATNQLLSWPVRVNNALWSYLLYVMKALWPLKLAIFYPHPESTLSWWKPVVGTAFLIAVSVWSWMQRRNRYVLAGWLWYLGCLVPVIGLVQVGRQAMADRYAYTPMLGIFVLVVWWLADGLPQERQALLGAIAAGFLSFCGLLTWQQTQYWKDSFTLFTHAIQITPPNFIAENNLGEAYVQTGQSDLAYEHFLRTTQIKPAFGLGHYNLGLALVNKNRPAEALEEFQLAVRYGQDEAEIASAFHNIGVVLLHNNQPADAARALTEALKLMPGKQSSHLARGMAEFQMNEFAAAEADFASGANRAQDAAANFWLGRAKEAQGKIKEAISCYQQALALQPAMDEAKERLSALQSGRTPPFIRSEP
jgi:tetratricopeptide (TPR) repeat protein